MILHIHLDPDTVKLGDIVIDAREKGRWGTGDLECSIRIMEELDSVKPLLDRAYLENWGGLAGAWAVEEPLGAGRGSFDSAWQGNHSRATAY